MNLKFIYSALFISAFNIGCSVSVRQFTKDADIANDKVAVVKCFATWCGHCKNFAPVYESIATGNSDKATFYEVEADTSEGKAFAGKHQIQGFPTTVVFNKGKEVDKVVGGNKDALVNAINAAQNVKAEEPKEVAPKSCGVVQEATSSAYFKKPGIVVVKFYGNSCQFCGPYAELFEKVAKDHSDFATFFQVDVDQHPEIQQEFEITGLPRTVVLKNGEVVDTISGANDSRLIRTLRSLKNGTPIIQPKITVEDGDKPARAKQPVKQAPMKKRKPVTKSKKSYNKKRPMVIEEEIED